MEKADNDQEYLIIEYKYARHKPWSELKKKKKKDTWDGKNVQRHQVMEKAWKDVLQNVNGEVKLQEIHFSYLPPSSVCVF